MKSNQTSEKKQKTAAETADHRYAELVLPAVRWYPEHHRDLPWRHTRDPYAVWISEIMLQQTRVETVIPYYERFLSQLPDIRSLALCPEDRLMKLWEGLGYYSRARNLQKAARVIEEQFGGRMPADHDLILSLPGIGPYTAGAVSSIAFGLPFSAIDGNALRILTRARCDGRNIAADRTKKSITAEMDTVLQKQSASDPDFDAGTFNQAMMEIGATVCLPNAEPRCALCPWENLCDGHLTGRMTEFPVKTKPKKRRIEEWTILIIRDGKKVLLRKRPEKGLLAGLYEFPGLEGHVSGERAAAYVRRMGLEPLRVEPAPDAKHIFSHVEWRMKAYVIRVAEVTGSEKQPWLLADLDCAREDYAIPGAFRTYTDLLWEKRRGQK